MSALPSEWPDRALNVATTDVPEVRHRVKVVDTWADIVCREKRDADAAQPHRICNAGGAIAKSRLRRIGDMKCLQE